MRRRRFDAALAALAHACERGLDAAAVVERAAAAAAAATGRRVATGHLVDGAAAVPEPAPGDLLVPLVAAGSTVGYLVVPRAGAVDERVGSTLRLIAALAAQAVETARLWDGATAGAAADALTGLPDHRGFDAALRRELARSLRTGEALAIVLVDLDGFGAVNAARGRAAGDRILHEVGARLAAALRPYDTVARVGSDRFGLVLPASDAPSAAALAARLTADVRATTGVGASAGVAAFPEHGATAGDLVALAAAALAEAARNGGRVIVADPDSPVSASAPAATPEARSSATARAVSEWAALVATELGLPPDQVDRMRLDAYHAVDAPGSNSEALAVTVARSFVAHGGDGPAAAAGRALAELWRGADRNDAEGLRALERVLAARAAA